jgi:hypothetical protein
MGTTKIWDGTVWRDLQGPPGPQEVSSDAGNLTTLGSDGKVYTDVAVADVQGIGTIATKGEGDYLPIVGGRLTGPLTSASTITADGLVTVGLTDGVANSMVRVQGALSGLADVFVNKSGGANLRLSGGGNPWTVAVPNTPNSMTIGTTGALNAISLARGADNPSSVITFQWPFTPQGGVTGGIDFNNTSSMGDRLDAYEEGQWVPAYSGDGAISATYVNTSGSYTRIGRVITCAGFIEVSAVAAGSTGNLRITGLPFPRVSGTRANGSVGFAHIWGSSAPVGITSDPTLPNALVLYDVAHLLNARPGLAFVPATALQAGSILAFSCTYFTDT